MNTIATNSIEKAAAAIRKGEVVGFPTETVYGLGADAFNAKAVDKIFAAKRRPADNPLIVHIYDKKQIPLIAAHIEPKAQKLINTFFPGSLTLVVKKNKHIPAIVTAGLNTVCIRMPSLPLCRRFLKACGVPVAAPSANISGKPSPTTWQHVLHDLDDRILVILKGPRCRHGLESTVIDCTKKTPVLLRPGAVSVEEIEKVIGKIKIPNQLMKNKKTKVLSPGMKYRHYSPNGKVHLVKRGTQIPINSAFIGFTKPKARANFAVIVKNTKEYAAKLYWFFRECDEKKIKNIYCELPESKGIGRALLNRLKKAAN
ncbi:MAG: L-threonylcarbamoyladenylate synthase [Candidatus Micrarchaeota archaeon]